MEPAERSDAVTGRTTAGRALVLLAILVPASEAIVLFAADSPAQHRWLVVCSVIAGLVIAVLGRLDASRRVAALSMVSGVALATRATVRVDVDISPTLAMLDTGATLCALLAGALGVFTLSRAIGRRSALLAGLTGLMVLTCLGYALERSPGAKLGVRATTLYKGPWPHRTFGQWYPPHSRVRSFYASNPRNYYDAPASLRRYWRLNLHSSDDRAELRFDPARPAVLRAEIAHAENGEPWKIQLNQGPLVVRGGTPYELRFAARADRAREISVGISEWHAPWEGLGYSRTIPLNTNWSTWTDTVTLFRDDKNARVHFDVGNDAASVEFSDLVLTDLTTGQRVLPDPLPFSLTHEFNDVGCRGADVLSASAGGDARPILVLGDSYALGLGVRDDDLFGTRLGRLLEESGRTVGAGGRAYQVLTCAVPGWGAREQRQFYEHLRGRYSPELVIVLTTWNDGRLERDESGPTPDDEARAAADTHRIAPALLQLANSVQADGSRLAVIVFRNTPGAIWTSLLDGLDPLPVAGVPVLDLWSSLNAHSPLAELSDEPQPTVLPNNIAHGIAATATAAFLRSKGLVR